jgi:hypothetical protein
LVHLFFVVLGPGKEIRNPQGNHPISAGIWVFLDLLCSGGAKEKIKKLVFITCFFPWKSQGKNLVFGLIARKMAYYYQEFTRKLPVFDPEPGSRTFAFGNYQEATRNLTRP